MKLSIATLLPLIALPGIITIVSTAAIRDVVTRIVPNGLSVAAILLGLAARIADGTLASGLTATAAVFALSAFCWRRGWLGGGDVKLLTACSLAVPPHLVPSLLLDTTLVGAALALVYLAARNRVQRPRPAPTRPRNLLARAMRIEQWRLSRGGPLPYAVAIATAAIIVLVQGNPP